MTGWFQLSVSCPNCLQMGTHHIGPRWSRPDSDDYEEIRSAMTGEIVRRDPVTPGGVFRVRSCLFCGHSWNQREEAAAGTPVGAEPHAREVVGFRSTR